MDGGNWRPYYLANESCSRKVPHISCDAVFSSGISGISGVIPDRLVLNKKTVMEILAEVVGVVIWSEVVGSRFPNAEVIVGFKFCASAGVGLRIMSAIKGKAGDSDTNRSC